MSDLRVTNLKGRTPESIPNFLMVVVTGVTTSTSFDGSLNSSNLTGKLTGTLDGSALTNLNIPSSFTELDALFN